MSVFNGAHQADEFIVVEEAKIASALVPKSKSVSSYPGSKWICLFPIS